MNHITTYAKLLKARTLFKRIQQLSWTVSKIEQKYNIDEMNPEDQNKLFEAYNSFLPELKNIYDELKDEICPIET